LAFLTNSVAMAAFAAEMKMHYSVMTEKLLATRWKISMKTLHRCRLGKVGPRRQAS
jgi:hypothetical protein